MTSDAPAGWCDALIGEVFTLQRGFDITRKQQRSGDIPVVSSGGVSSFHDTAMVKGPGVVIGRKGTLGTAFYLPTDYWPHDTTLWVKDFKKSEPKFVYYFFKNFDVTHLDVGSANPTLNRNHVHALPVRWPPRDEQERIAGVLGTLDDKIGSNRRLAALLEETAAALFKARFVDFVGLEEFEDSEIGPIPVGWCVGSVYDFASVTYGRPFKSELFDPADGIPLIRIRDLATAEPSVRTPEEREDARLIRPGDIVVGMDGEFRAHLWAGPDSWLNQRVCAFDPVDGFPRAFVFHAIRRPLAFFEATKGGTTVIHLGKADIDTFRAVLPIPTVMREFANVADPLVEQSVTLRTEARTLAEVRDALLPRLISGAIRVPDTTDADEVSGPLAEATS